MREEDNSRQDTSPIRYTQMTLSAVGAAGEWLGTIRSAVKQEREKAREDGPDQDSDMLRSAIAKMLTHFEVLGVFLEFSWEAWEGVATSYIEDVDKLQDVEMLTLRKLLSYHGYKSGLLILGEERPRQLRPELSLDYWAELAMNGHLLRILRRFQTIYSEVADRIQV